MADCLIRSKLLEISIFYFKFQTVEVFVGEPYDTAELREEVMKQEGLTEIEKRKRITDQLQTKLYELGERVKQLPKGTASKLLQQEKEKELTKE